MWGLYSPIAWPFVGLTPKKTDIINDAKQLAQAAGGDMVLSS